MTQSGVGAVRTAELSDWVWEAVYQLLRQVVDEVADILWRRVVGTIGDTAWRAVVWLARWVGRSAVRLGRVLRALGGGVGTRLRAFFRWVLERGNGLDRKYAPRARRGAMAVREVFQGFCLEESSPEGGYYQTDEGSREQVWATMQRVSRRPWFKGRPVRWRVVRMDGSEDPPTQYVTVYP